MRPNSQITAVCFCATGFPAPCAAASRARVAHEILLRVCAISSLLKQQAPLTTSSQFVFVMVATYKGRIS